MLQMQLIGKFHTPAVLMHTYNPVAASHAKCFPKREIQRGEQGEAGWGAHVQCR